MREYNRFSFAEYAATWALLRNPNYLDFEELGGDCTNFASQCIYAGAGIMNYTKDIGWYYNSAYDRAAAWTNANYLNRFLLNNKSAGPFGKRVKENELEPGDIVQLSQGTEFYHSLVVTDIINGEVFVSAHTLDAFMKPLRRYIAQKFEYIHIIGVNDY